MGRISYDVGWTKSGGKNRRVLLNVNAKQKSLLRRQGLLLLYPQRQYRRLSLWRHTACLHQCRYHFCNYLLRVLHGKLPPLPLGWKADVCQASIWFTP